MSILITRDILDSRICDVEDCDNTQTYREFIHESYGILGLPITDEELDDMTDDERTQILAFADETWGK